MAKIELSSEFLALVQSMNDASKQSHLIMLYIERNNVNDAMHNDCELQAAVLEVERLFAPYKMKTKENKLSALKAKNDNNGSDLMAILGKEFENQQDLSMDINMSNAEGELADLKGPYVDDLKVINAKIDHIISEKFGN